MSELYQYFKENMEALSLPAPESLFGNLQTALASAYAILAGIDKFGTKVTIGELIGAGTRVEQPAVVSGCLAAYYFGGVRLLACGVCAAALAWGLWAWLGEYMVVVLNVAAVASLLLENRRLRKKLRAVAAVQGESDRDTPRTVRGTNES